MILKLLLAELGYRKLNAALGLLAVTVAAALFVAGPVLIDSYGRETNAEMGRMDDQTRKLMRDMGFNLLIVHRDTNMSDFWASDFSAVDMPQEYVERLARAPQLTLVTHLVATLQEKVSWRDRKVLLVGYLPEATQSHLAEKSSMGYRIEPGTVYLGHELGAGRKPGDTIEILGKSFRISRILPEQGSKEDITLAVRLEDAQAILNKPGRVNQIMALGCRCAGERLPKVRRQLGEVLPETKITEFRSMAVARAEERDLVAESRGKFQARIETLAAVTTPLLLLACGAWIGLLALANVRERRSEIGLLRSLGKSSVQIASLFLGKAALLGLAGGALGLVLGAGLARFLGVYVLNMPAEYLEIRYGFLAWTLAGAPVLAAAASYLPTLSAVAQDPATVLRET
jgi:putative ABC transport system permease protein